MNNLIILFVMILCIFGPMAIFGFIGHKAMEELGKRPSQGGRVIVPLIFKLTVTAGVLVGILMVVLEVFG